MGSSFHWYHNPDKEKYLASDTPVIGPPTLNKHRTRSSHTSAKASVLVYGRLEFTVFTKEAFLYDRKALLFE
jgi:hypothetical protein